MQTPLVPTAIQKIGTEFAVAWSDGAETFIPLEALRKNCPCAACMGEADVTGRVVKPPRSFGPASFDLVRWRVVGGYAIQPLWGDGHESGLYTFDFLRRNGL